MGTRSKGSSYHISCFFFIVATVSLVTCKNNAFPKSFTDNRYKYDTVNSVGSNNPNAKCNTAACKHIAAQIKQSMDPSVNPCDDFYQFACGNFLKKAIIRNEQTTNSSFLLVHDNIQTQLKAGLEKKIGPKDSEAHKKLKSYYEVCMNEKIREQNSMGELKAHLNEMGGWPVLLKDQWSELGYDWIKIAYKQRAKGFPYGAFFEMSVSEDIQNNKKKQLYLTGPSFGIKQEHLIIGSDPKIRAAYLKFMIDSVGHFGVNKTLAAQEMLEIFNLERTLAQNLPTLEDQRNPALSFHATTIYDLARGLPYIPWLEYINKIFSPHKVFKPSDPLIITAPKYFKYLGGILAETPKRVIANYIGWRMLWQSIGSMPSKFRNTYNQLVSAQSGITGKSTRWLTCLTLSTLRFPLAIGSLYVRNYFDATKKARIEKIVQHMHDTFEGILRQVNWMDEATKKAALEKLKAMKSLIAYPPELTQDNKLNEVYKNVQIDPNSAIKTELSLNRFLLDTSFAAIDKPTDKFDWKGIFGAAATTNAFYAPTSNSIIFPSGILQTPFFDVEYPTYMNYASIGYVVGHEMTHGFDDMGRGFDKEGNMRTWWDQQTILKFIEKAKCVVKQYSNYTEKLVNMQVNGVITLGENIADNGGIKIAYKAYENWLSHNPEDPRLPGFEAYTPKQLFWISNAHLQCTKYRPQSLANLMISDTHAPAASRVIGTFSNRPEFAADFKCPLGSHMNPVQKCSVW